VGIERVVECVGSFTGLECILVPPIKKNIYIRAGSPPFVLLYPSLHQENLMLIYLFIRVDILIIASSSSHTIVVKKLL
jgi:hypothetical protein